MPFPGMYPTMPFPGMYPTMPFPGMQPTQPFPFMYPTMPFPGMQPTQPVPDAQPTQPVPDVQPTKPVPDVQPTKPVPDVQPTQPVPDAQPTQPDPQNISEKDICVFLLKSISTFTVKLPFTNIICIEDNDDKIIQYNIWSKIISDNKYSYYLIISNDVISIEDNMEQHFTEFMQKLSKTVDICLLGYDLPKRYVWNNIQRLDECSMQIIPFDKSKYDYNIVAYCISKEGARKIIEYICKNGWHGEKIDTLIMKMENLEIYSTQPHLFLKKR
jgi:hypothetical protein